MMNRININRKLVLATLLQLVITSQLAAQPKLEELADNPNLFLETARKFFRWDEPAEPAKLLGPIYFVGTKGLGVYLVTTSEGHIVINTGMPGSGPMIEASIRKLGFKPEEIKILLVGHAHIDHAGGHAYLKKLSGGRIAVIREEQALLESGGKLDFHYGNDKAFQFEPAKVDQVFQDGDVVKLGDVTIKCVLTPGHTRGSTTFVMDVVDKGTKYNVLFPNGTSVNPGYRVAKDPSYPGIADDFRRTFRTLAAFKPEVWIHPHTEAFGFEAKLARSAKEGAAAWVDPDGYKKWLTGAREKFEAAVEHETNVERKTGSAVPPK